MFQYKSFGRTSPFRYVVYFNNSATREKISSAACPTPGCKGIGHVKGAKYSTHHSTFGCPYSLQNLNKDSCLVDRLSNNSMTEESDWSYASKQKLAVVKAIKGKEVRENAYCYPLELHFADPYCA